MNKIEEYLKYLRDKHNLNNEEELINYINSRISHRKFFTYKLSIENNCLCYTNNKEKNKYFYWTGDIFSIITKEDMKLYLKYLNKYSKREKWLLIKLLNWILQCFEKNTNRHIPTWIDCNDNH